MKKFFLIIIICLLAGNIFSQSVAGITGKRDTAYNVNSEYQKLLTTYPDVKRISAPTASKVAEEKNIFYCNTQERNLALDVFYPAKRSKHKKTAILIIHGGGWRSGSKDMFHSMAQHLAALGYVCFTPEYRLSTEALYPAGVYDVKAAIRWVRKNAWKYNIDTNKIVVAGHSAGGELAAMMGATNGLAAFEGSGCDLQCNSKVNAVIDLDGLLAFIHPESGEGDDSKRISAATNWFGFSKTENPELWKQGSPLTHVGKHTPPILFINSNVARMHAGREDFIKILKEHDIYSEIQFFDAPHSFVSFEPWFTPTIKYMDDFLKRIFAKQ
jgi:acetyl esterase/lipase